MITDRDKHLDGQLVMALVTIVTTTSSSSDPKLLDGAGDVVWRARYIDRKVPLNSLSHSATTAAIEWIDGHITTVYTKRGNGGGEEEGKTRHDNIH